MTAIRRETYARHFRPGCDAACGYCHCPNQTLPTPRPNRSPRLGDRKGFAGGWTCKGTTFPSSFGPAHPTAATIHVSWVLCSYWLRAMYAETQTPKNRSEERRVG